MNDVMRRIYETLMGFTIETTKDYLIMKIDKDEFIKKVLAMMMMHERDIEYFVDEKYIVVKIPVLRLGREALQQLGIRLSE